MAETTTHPALQQPSVWLAIYLIVTTLVMFIERTRVTRREGTESERWAFQYHAVISTN